MGIASVAGLRSVQSTNGIAHGRELSERVVTGSRRGRFTREEVLEMRHSSESVEALAVRFGIAADSVRKIIDGTNYSWVVDHDGLQRNCDGHAAANSARAK